MRPLAERSIRTCLECSCVDDKDVGQQTGAMAANTRRVPAGCVRMCFSDELHVFVECPAYISIWAKYGRDVCFQGRNMRTIVTEAAQLALVSFLSEIWETRCAVLSDALRYYGRGSSRCYSGL